MFVHVLKQKYVGREENAEYPAVRAIAREKACHLCMDECLCRTGFSLLVFLNQKKNTPLMTPIYNVFPFFH